MNHLFDEPPIVIGGCARSGTTLLLSVLSCHPNIYAIPDETWFLCPDANGEIPDPPRLALPKLLRKVRCAKDKTAHRWMEKSPKNALYFEAIQKALPEAKILNIVRDGRDVCTSIHPSAPERYWVDPARWVREVSAGFAVEGPLTIHYEDLILDYPATVECILDFIGEEYDPAFDDYPGSATVQQSGAWMSGSALPLHDTSIGRWRQPGHADALADFLAYPGAADLLHRVGYA